jgi:membrane glycosyltransferase
VLGGSTGESDGVVSDGLTARRLLFAALVLGTMAAMIWLVAAALSPGGFGFLDVVLIVLFAITLPWTLIGFWNAVIGLLIMRLFPNPAAAVLPALARVKGNEPITASTAILLCIRNEVPERMIRNVEPMLDGLVAAGAGGRFHLYVLSDTNNPDIASAEQIMFGALAARWEGRLAVTYRKRTENTGFKAGNVRDFCERWGGDHEFAVTLDADSFMPAEAVLRMVRIMQADPKLGILQGLVVGLPSTSAFARLFQFSMRLSMRSYTLGSAWWQGDCGPYWGHNAVLRLQPFIAHCHIAERPETLRLGGHVLSHDQIEAVLMRNAGYEVRVLPEEELGWEENPPTLIEFIRRDLRWCQGNMQYWPFLFMPGLKFISRYQLLFAILMFLGSPAWIGLLVFGTLALSLTGTPTDFVRPDAALAILVLVPVMWFAPQLATAIDVLMSSKARAAYGGTARFLVNVVIVIVFTILLCPIMWFGHTMFLARLLLGREIGWAGQTRDDHMVPTALAARYLWPHTLLGIVCLIVLAATHPGAIPYALYLAAGPSLAIPFAVVTAVPSMGLAFARLGIGRLPEETAPPHSLGRLALPAIAAAAPFAQPRLA